MDDTILAKLAPVPSGVPESDLLGRARYSFSRLLLNDQSAPYVLATTRAKTLLADVRAARTSVASVLEALSAPLSRAATPMDLGRARELLAQAGSLTSGLGTTLREKAQEVLDNAGTEHHGASQQELYRVLSSCRKSLDYDLAEVSRVVSTLLHEAARVDLSKARDYLSWCRSEATKRIISDAQKESESGNTRSAVQHVAVASSALDIPLQDGAPPVTTIRPVGGFSRVSYAWASPAFPLMPQEDMTLPVDLQAEDGSRTVLGLPIVKGVGPYVQSRQMGSIAFPLTLSDAGPAIRTGVQPAPGGSYNTAYFPQGGGTLAVTASANMITAPPGTDFLAAGVTAGDCLVDGGLALLGVISSVGTTTLALDRCPAAGAHNVKVCSNPTFTVGVDGTLYTVSVTLTFTAVQLKTWVDLAGSGVFGLDISTPGVIKFKTLTNPGQDRTLLVEKTSLTTKILQVQTGIGAGTPKTSDLSAQSEAYPVKSVSIAGTFANSGLLLQAIQAALLPQPSPVTSAVIDGEGRIVLRGYLGDRDLQVSGGLATKLQFSNGVNGTGPGLRDLAESWESLGVILKDAGSGDVSIEASGAALRIPASDGATLLGIAAPVGPVEGHTGVVASTVPLHPGCQLTLQSGSVGVTSKTEDGWRLATEVPSTEQSGEVRSVWQLAYEALLGTLSPLEEYWSGMSLGVPQATWSLWFRQIRFRRRPDAVAAAQDLLNHLDALEQALETCDPPTPAFLSGVLDDLRRHGMDEAERLLLELDLERFFTLGDHEMSSLATAASLAGRVASKVAELTGAIPEDVQELLELADG